MEDEGQNDNLTTILVSSDTTEVAAAKSALDEAGIAYSLKGEGLQNLYGPGTFQMEVQVTEENATRARQVLADYWNGPPLTDDTEVPDLPPGELDAPPSPPDPGLTDRQRGCLGFFIAVLFVLIASGLYQVIANPSSASVSRRSKDLMEQGRTLYRRKDYDGAKNLLSKAIQTDQGNAEAYGLRGLVAYNTRDYKSSIADFTHEIGLNHGGDWTYSARALPRLALSEYETALEDINVAIKMNPEESRYYRIRGDIYLAMKWYDDALQDFDQAVNLAPTEYLNYYRRAASYYRMKDYAHALLNYDEVIRFKPDEAEAYLYRSYCQGKLEHSDYALRDAEKAVELAPQDPVYLAHRAWQYQYAAQYDKAAKDCEEAIKLKPNSANVYHTMAVILEGTNETTRALENLNHALELDSTSTIAASCHISLGWLRYLDGAYADARREFEKAINLDPESVSAHENLACTFVHLGMTSEGEEETSYVMKARPDSAYAYDCRGDFKRITGNLTGALEDYNKAIEKNMRPSYYGDRALVYLALGKKEDAQRDFEKCYSLNKYLKPRFEKWAAEINDKRTSEPKSGSF